MIERILIVADLHYSLKQFDWVLREADQYAMVVVAGDLLDVAGFAGLDAQIVVVLKYLERLREKTRVLVCSGNHDGDTKNEAGEYIAAWIQRAKADQLHVDNESVAIDGDLFSICPWWDGPVTREEMRNWLLAEREKRGGRWLWLHHAPPADSPICWTGKLFAGDADLKAYISDHRPDFVFCGHIHNSPFSDGGSWIDRIDGTWVFNPGRQIGDFPTHIVVDLAAMTASWFSYTKAEEVDLRAEAVERRPLT